MEYYKLLQLHREPFSNSPDPEYFFNSKQHMGCLQKLELALRLKRGLNVIIGDVGTGKTTLCRQLIRKFSTEPDIDTHLILDPSFDSSAEFLKSVMEMISPQGATDGLSQTEMKEMIKRTLFKLGVDEDKTIVLIIDEGQKISDPCLEILRELLNYETNTFKLLQIVIFAQLEFDAILEAHANFADRINLRHHLEPLSFTDTRHLIQHRLKLSSSTAKPTAVFTLPALWAIYRASRGYPRKIIHLCHQSILALIIQNQTKAGWALIQSCKNRIGASSLTKRKMVWMTALALGLTIVAVILAPVLKSQQDTRPHTADHKTIVAPAADAKAIAETPHVSATQTEPDDVQSVSVALPAKVMSPSEGAFKIVEDEALPDRGTEIVGIETPGGTMSQPDEEGLPNTVQAPSSENPPSAEPPAPTDNPAEEILASVNSPQNVSASPAPTADLPKFLGRLIVQPGDTLSGLSKLVYGTRQNRSLKSLIEANSHIEDPNEIHIGDVITFPLHAFKTSKPSTPHFLVVLSESRTLTDAIQRLQTNYAQMISRPALVSSWTPSKGLQFQLVQKQYFLNQDNAQTSIGQLPDDIAAQAAIITGWPDETIFYSDPFRDLEQHFN